VVQGHPHLGDVAKPRKITKDFYIPCIRLSLLAIERADERTRTADPCSSYECALIPLCVSGRFNNGLSKPHLPVQRFSLFAGVRPGYCHGYCQAT
jgi:hypothetical protein